MRPFLRLQPFRSSSRATPSLAPRPFFLLRNVHRPLHTSRVSKQQQDGATTIETVKIHRPAFTWTRVMVLVAYAGGSYYMMQFFLGQFASRLGIEEEDFEEGGEEGDEEDDSVFVAFQLPSKLPRTFYKQSDPEWQEFVKISNDETRKEDLKDELAQKVAGDVSKHPSIKMRLGGNINLTKSWLELKYPDSPPPEYARQGVEIAPEYVAWSTQVIPHSHYVQLKHILYPHALFSAFSNSLRVFGRLQTVKLKEALGYPLNNMDKQIQAISRLEQSRRALSEQKSQLEAQRDATTAQGRELLPPPNLSTPPAAAAGPATQPPTTTAISTPASSFFPTSFYPSTFLPSKPFLPRQENLPIDLSIAWKMFASTLMHTWGASRIDQEPRGSFLVVGQVEVTGNRGKVKCDVKAAYDPKSAKYLYVKTTVKHFWELKQSAKGGP